MSEISDSSGQADSTAPDVVREFHDAETDESLAYTVVTAVAAIRDTDPVDLPTLYECVDVDALDALVDGSRTRPGGVDGHVTFAYAGCEVTVDFDGWIRLSPLTDESVTPE